MNDAPPIQRPPRIQQVIFRPARDSIFEKLISIILAVAGIVLFVAIVAIFELMEFSTGPAIAMDILLLIVALAVSAIPLILWIMFGRYTRRRILKKAGRRYRRLCRIVEHPQAMQRLPHRVLEHAMCATYKPEKMLLRIARQVPPGRVIIGRKPSAERLAAVAPCDISFEPIDMQRDAEQTAWLHYLGDPSSKARIDAGDFDPAAPPDGQQLDTDSQDAAPSDRRPLLKRVFVDTPIAVFMFAMLLLFTVGPWILGGYWIYRAYRTPTTHNLLLAALPFAAFIMMFLGNVYRKRSFYLIPGGMAVQRIGLAGRNAGVTRLTPASTSIVADTESDRILLVTHGEKPIQFTFDLRGNNSLLTAWLGSAATPSQQQLETLLNPKG